MTPALLAATLLAIASSSHPIHSSSAEVRPGPGAGTTIVTVRAFADDFPPGTDSVAAAEYLAARFRVVGRNGRPAKLLLNRLSLEGAVVVASLTAMTPEGLGGAHIWHGVLTERFDDQVNLVLVHHRSRASRLVFTANDAAKPVP